MDKWKFFLESRYANCYAEEFLEFTTISRHCSLIKVAQ